MDNEANEILSRRVLWDCCSAKLPFLDFLAQHKLDAVVSTFLRLDELWNLDLLCFEVYLHAARTFKTLMVVIFWLELWKSALMSKELLECFVKMRDSWRHALDIDFSHPWIVFLKLMVFIWDTDAHPTKMLLQLRIFLNVKVKCPVVDETHSPKVLSKKHLLVFCRI